MVLCSNGVYYLCYSVTVFGFVLMQVLQWHHAVFSFVAITCIVHVAVAPYLALWPGSPAAARTTRVTSLPSLTLTSPPRPLSTLSPRYSLAPAGSSRRQFRNFDHHKFGVIEYTSAGLTRVRMFTDENCRIAYLCTKCIISHC